MNRLEVKLLAVFLIMFSVTEARAYATPVKREGLIYYTPIDYHNSTVKKDARMQGAYLYYGKGDTSAIEVEYDYSRFNLVSGLEYRQRDYTFVYTKYAPGKSNKVGLRVMDTSTLTEDGETFIFGMSKFDNNGRNSQVDAYISKYDIGAPDVLVYQVSPSLGRTIKKGEDASLYLNTKVNYIHTTKEIANNPTGFFSVEQKFAYTKKDVVYTATGWLGRQLLAVRNDGFIVFNNAETHKGGYSGSINFKISPQSRLTFSGGKEYYRDAGANNDATSTQWGVTLTNSF